MVTPKAISLRNGTTLNRCFRCCCRLHSDVRGIGWARDAMLGAGISESEARNQFIFHDSQIAEPIRIDFDFGFGICR
jgi:hypothetical protein